MPRVPLKHPETGEVSLATEEGALVLIERGYVDPEAMPKRKSRAKPEPQPEPIEGQTTVEEQIAAAETEKGE